jgi:hypothetical protein
MMAADRDWEQIFKTTGPRLPNATTPAPLQSEWRAFQKRKLCYRTLYNPITIDQTWCQNSADVKSQLSSNCQCAHNDR